MLQSIHMEHNSPFFQSQFLCIYTERKVGIYYRALTRGGNFVFSNLEIVEMLNTYSHVLLVDSN